MRRLGLSVFALAAGLSVAGVVCSGGLDATLHEDCASFCAFAERCGVLPSPLGAAVEGVSAVDNCVGRCQLTDPVERKRFTTSCWDASPGDLDIERGWCGPDEVRRCAQGAACLESALPDSGVLGQARLDVVFGACGPRLVVSEPAEAGCDRDPDVGTAPECGSLLSSDEAARWCNEVQAAEVEISVEQRGQIVAGAKGTCALLLGQTTTFGELRPGPARASVRIRRARDGGAASPEDCIVFYGAERVLRASVAETSHIALAGADAGAALSAITCEITQEECAGGVDEDKDGHIDCSDPDCQPFCDAGAAGIAPP